MVIWPKRFNTYLAVLAALAPLAGCMTASDRALERHAALLRLHIEAKPDRTDRTEPVTIARAGLTVNVEKEPFVTEVNVKEAKVMEAMGSFALLIQFDQRGSMLLEQYTANNPGKHFAIFARFGEKLRTGRWLSAPVINRRIGDGVLVFAPDATREEAEQIALGLNNVAAKVQSKSEQ